MKVEGFKSQEELIDNLYQASTLADKNARPYAGSDISIEEVNINAFQPTQRYVINSGVRKQEDLRKLILPYSEDTLHMKTGGISIVDEENGNGVMLPPIIEEDSREGLLLVDGMHRTTMARCIGMTTIRAVVIRGVDSDFAVTKRRLPNEWNEVTTFPTLGDLKIARKQGFVHRNKGSAPGDGSTVYRDFSSFTGRGKDVRK
ncbi:MAG: hypothetical protein HXK98_01165 [Candidatus Nanogingivalaceae bacterium]|nr:hypothetical protein [Candidatus Nanogingivalaceae bacterium]